MKKTLMLLVVIAVAFTSASAFAINQKNTGCGLGSILFEGKDGFMSETCAATTNGMFYSQILGITSGTSNCEESASAEAAANAKATIFIAENMDSLAKDVAQGNGEYLNTLSILMNVKDGTSFNSKLQSNFSTIFNSTEVSAQEVLTNIKTVLSAS